MTPEEQRIAIAEFHFASLIAGYEFYQQVKGTTGYRYCDLGGCWIYRKGDAFYGMNYNSKEDCFNGNVKELAKRNDYPNDLNAMNQAWNIKAPPPFTDEFSWNCELAWQLELIVKKSIHWPQPNGLEGWDNLIWSAKNYLIANATAAQRAEAFLRTVGKWKDGHCSQHIGDGA
jgi:hypothetical protein